MKHCKIILSLVFLLLLAPVTIKAEFLQTTDQITISSAAIDTLGYDQLPDSIRIWTYLNGAEVYEVKYTSSDAQVIANSGQYVFTDVISNIDGAGGNGFYTVAAKFMYDGGNSRLGTMWKYLDFYIGGDARFQATGFSTHSAADNWTAGTRTLTIADWTTDSDLSNLDVAISSRSSHDAAGVYTEFISGTNENEFKADIDSVNNSITDANKSNFKATGFSISSDLDSVNNAIVDANKSNFKAVGFSTHSKGDIWDELKSAHTTAGTYGAFLDDTISEVSSLWTQAQIDSAMAMITRIGIASYAVCDSMYVIEYPLNSKPKDSIMIYCVCNAGVDTTLVGTMSSEIFGLIRTLSSSTRNVLNYINFERR